METWDDLSPSAVGSSGGSRDAQDETLELLGSKGALGFKGALGSGEAGFKGALLLPALDSHPLSPLASIPSLPNGALTLAGPPGTPGAQTALQSSSKSLMGA